MLFYGVTSAQSLSVSGQVVEQHTHTPIAKAQVKVLKAKENLILAFTQTNQDGSFKIKKEVNETDFVLEVSCIGYAPQQRIISIHADSMFIEMERKEIALKEVVVNPAKIRAQGDTVRYLVSAFSNANDRTIGDVLKKMPGIEITESGEIKYQGKSLNKFYIEGSDLLGGRYGLATNNISYKDVANVEIMENHQPVKAFQDIVFSDQPALNLKLKEDAKFHWVGTGKGGLGFTPLLWNVEAFAMRFKTKMQTLNTYKGNNTGYNSSGELLSFSSVGDFVPDNENIIPTYIQVNPSSIPDLDKNRSRFNTTNTFSSNSLFKIKKDYDLLSEVIYSNNLMDYEKTVQTTYYMDNEKYAIENLAEKAGEHIQSAEGKLKLKANRDKFYLNNALQFYLDRNNTEINMDGTYPNLQESSIRNRKISNDFSLLQRIGKKTIVIRSLNEYALKPQILTVTKSGETPLLQDIDLSAFLTNNSINYSFGLGLFRVSAKSGLLYSGRQMKNSLGDSPNISSFNKFKLDITPSIEYSHSPFEARLTFPVYCLHYGYEENNKIFPHNIYSIDPNLFLKWYASPFLEWYASASYGKDLPDENLFYGDSILNNYRNINVGYTDFATGSKTNFMTGAKYKDIMRTLFISTEFALMHTQRKRMSKQDFTGDYIVNSYFLTNNDRDVFLANVALSKGIEAVNGMVSIYPSYIHSMMVMNRNGVQIPYRSNVYSLRGKVNSSLNRWCNLIYGVNFSHSNMGIKNERKFSSSNHFSETFKLAFIPKKSLQMTVAAEHYCNQLSSGQYKNFVFIDGSISYLLGSSWEIACSAKNLLNKQYYSFFIEDGLNTVSNYYKIRPVNVIVNVMYRY